MSMDKGCTTALLTHFIMARAILFFSEYVFANLIWISWSHKHVIFYLFYAYNN